MNIIKKLFQPKTPYINGVLPDDRPEKEREKDYLTEEIIKEPIMAMNWITWEVWKSRPENIKMLSDIKVNSQGSVGSCASQAGSLALAINNYLEDKRFIKLSAKPIYARRRNKPRRGMHMDNLANICREYGTVPEKLYPSPNDTEANMSNLDGYISAFEGMAKVLRAKNYFWITKLDNIDNVANILALGKPVVLTVIYGDHEFGETIPTLRDTNLKYGHAITILPNAYFTYKGKKAVLIQNSWGDYGFYGGRQILTEDWFARGRVLYAIWFEDMDNLAVHNFDFAKPTFHFMKDLYYGMKNSDVAMLQRCLGYEKDTNGYMFPLYQSPTGWYGGLTLKAVKRFQTKYGIEPVLGYCGVKTRAKLNKLFA